MSYSNSENNHFGEYNEMVEIESGAKREIRSVMLMRKLNMKDDVIWWVEGANVGVALEKLREAKVPESFTENWPSLEDNDRFCAWEQVWAIHEGLG